VKIWWAANLGILHFSLYTFTIYKFEKA